MQAIAAAAPAVLSAFSNQGKSRGPLDRPKMETALPVLSASEKKRLKKLLKEADKERLYNLLVQPEVLGLLITFAGLYAANNIPFTGNDAQNAALQATASSAAVLLGLGYAGVGDLTTLLIAAGAGGGSLVGNLIGGSDRSFLSLFGPLGMIADKYI